MGQKRDDMKSTHSGDGCARLRHAAKAFLRDTRGLILPYVTIMLVVIIGVALLALDGARLMSLQTQLQNGADALALAGAAELDRLPDAELRATNAINRLLANATLFGDGANRTVRVAAIQFYSRLPPSDGNPMSEGTLADDPTNARFVAVTVQPVTLTTVLPALMRGSTLVTTGASAVAGFDQVVCEATPIFVCNPYETAGMTYDQAIGALQAAVADPTVRRRLIRLRQYGDEIDPLAAGDYGFLETPTLAPSSDALVDAIAQARPPACFAQSSVTFRAGAVMTAREGFNVRFDIYEGAMRANRFDPNYRPAENVRKGYVGGGASPCNAQPATNWPIGSPPGQATGMPLDRAYPYMDGRMGNGTWDFDTYWQVNHGGDGRTPPVLESGPASNSNLPSRYTVYRYEIEEGFVGDRSPGGENGAPACYAGGTLSGAPDRRILYAAIINCQSLGLAGGAQANVPVAAFAKLFLTLPMARGSTDLYVELVGLVRPGDDGNFDMVQLYR
jgi:Flp pilus assembly protein TadG